LSPLMLFVGQQSGYSISEITYSTDAKVHYYKTWSSLGNID